MLQVVWFKRDLRVRDHRPLHAAAARGPVLPLYVAEPSVCSAPDFGPRHWTLLAESLRELRATLAARGQPLVVRMGEMPGVLEDLRQRLGPFRLWAHEETGNALTYARDRRVRRWARARAVAFVECEQTGVTRGLGDRDGWAARWEAQMHRPLVPVPDALRPAAEAGFEGPPGALPTHADLGLAPDLTAVQAPGEAAAHDLLASFLHRRGRTYQHGISSPLTAEASCSRLSVHFALGTLSLRTVVQALEQRTADLAGDPDAGAWRRSLASFGSRLRWHSHFMQKLDDAPRIEHESFIPAFDALRDGAFDPALYVAWKEGRTGFPMVDASMRCLRATGWLNFRMRAMLCSFAAYDLWLDWRRFGAFYARMMADYEPGIHYPQLQMQSGTTGINTVRIYNPVKQGKDHDPDGTFIRRWVPELAGLKQTAYVHEPWKMTPIEQQSDGCVIGEDYPARVVDHTAAYRRARDRIYALRETDAVQAAKEAVLEKHGSRKRR